MARRLTTRSKELTKISLFRKSNSNEALHQMLSDLSVKVNQIIDALNSIGSTKEPGKTAPRYIGQIRAKNLGEGINTLEMMTKEGWRTIKIKDGEIRFE